jgi:hypothetical protein
MKFDKYIGFDLHQVAVLDEEGKVMETIVATEASAIIRLLRSLSGPLHVTRKRQDDFLHTPAHDVVYPSRLCDPRRNKLLGEGSKADKPDARKC